MEPPRAFSLPGAPPRAAGSWPRRVLLVGGDSVVTRALLIYLRKEGMDAAIVSEDPASWVGELGGRPHGGATRAIVVSPDITGSRRAGLCRRLRQDPHLTSVPVLALRDAGDDGHARAVRAGVIGGPAATRPDPVELADVTLSWPFRLREVHRTLDTLLRRAAAPPQSATA